MVGNNSNLEIFNRIKETNSNNADEYSNSKTYVKDEYCIYNNTLYKANQAINTAEEFTESHWTETTVGTELKSQADSISSLNSRMVLISGVNVTFTDGAGTIAWGDYVSKLPSAAIPVMRYENIVYDCTLTVQIIDSRIILYARSNGAIFEGKLVLDILLIMS